MSEFRRAIIRITANYIRLAIVFVMGLALVKLLLRTIGPEAFGLVSLIGYTVGFAIMLEEIVGWSSIRELGAAHHSGDARRFKAMYNSAIVVAAGASVLTLVVFAIILAILPLLNIDDDLMGAARWFVIAKGAESAVGVLLAPQMNMYVVLERMVAYNAWFVARRASMVIAAVALFWIDTSNHAGALIWYGWISTGLYIVATVAGTSMIMAQDRRLAPHVQARTREGFRALLAMSGWNGAILGSQSLGVPAGQIIMNLAFGLTGNRIFGLATQFSAYTRMIVSGMTAGLDAVSARLSSSTAADSHSTMHRLMHHSTRIHGFVAFPTAMTLFLLAAPGMHLWVAEELGSDSPEIHAAVVLSRILIIAQMCMCLADNWMRILYGAGHVRSYARLAVAGGLFNLALAGILLVFLPESARYTAVAIAFSTMYVIVHLGLVPGVAARAFTMSYTAVFAPLLRPLLASLAASPILLLFLWNVSDWNLPWLIAAAACYGIVYGGLAWIWVLQPSDRARVLALLATRGAVRSDPA